MAENSTKTQQKFPPLGDFEVLAEFGETATGTVYQVKDPKTGAVHMAKVLDPSLIERAGGVETIRGDLEKIQSLRHPNVGRILQTHLETAPLFIVSEYIDGLPLRSLLEQRRLSFTEGFRVFREVCEGLAAAHSKGLIHRDLNPKNVIVSRDLSVVKITDFGLGPLKDFSHEVSHGDTGQIDARTLKYLAPEFLRDEAGDERSDIYSAGVLCYEALTGRTPAGKFSLPSQLNSEAPSELDPIVLRCLSSDRGGRYSTAEELIQDIRQLEERLRLSLAESFGGLAGVKNQRSRRIRTILLSLLVLSLIALVFSVGISRKREAAKHPPPAVESTSDTEAVEAKDVVEGEPADASQSSTSSEG